MIIKTPKKPLSIVDIKTVFVTMLYECECCSTDTPNKTVMTYESEDYGEILINLCSLSLPSSPRAFSLLHHAVEISNGLVSICPSYCNRCEDMKCDACCNFRECLQCHDSICNDCENVENCSKCDGFNCTYCDYSQCNECGIVFCHTCADGLGCEDCNKYICSECLKLDEFEKHSCWHGPSHWFCDDCKVICEGCKIPYCNVDWEECGYITCGICKKDKCWTNCIIYINCGKCDQAICKQCESDVRFCFKCQEFYCFPQCRSFKICYNCWESTNESMFCEKCCDGGEECFRCHEPCLCDMW